MLKQLSDVLENMQEREGAPRALDMRVKPHIRIIRGSLDEDPDSPTAIILNGRIAPSTLRFLKADSSYQRPLESRADIFEALKAGVIVPSIDIGVRGRNFEMDGDDYVIHDEAYVIDGWQRVGNALRLMELVPDLAIRIFATVHFGTEPLWERHRFTELNKNIRKVSPNLHLRNMRDGNEAVLTLFGLSKNDRGFAFYDKVSWSQNMNKGELITAGQLTRAAMMLHMHHGALAFGQVEKMAAALLKEMKAVGQMNFRRNITTFADVIDECWGVKSIEIRMGAPQIKQGFMNELARFFSSHKDFWDAGDRIFFVSADHRRKLAKFPINDPHIKNLCGSGGAARSILHETLLKHMNSGKRTHFQSRYMKGPSSPALWRRAQ